MSDTGATRSGSKAIGAAGALAARLGEESQAERFRAASGLLQEMAEEETGRDDVRREAASALQWLERVEERLTAPRGPAPPDPPQEGTTAHLVAQVRQGNRFAREQLAGRFLSALKRFAHGRLPKRARDHLDTSDLVQVAVVRALNKVDGGDFDRKGAFLAYLRQVLMNLIRDEIRRTSRKPQTVELTGEIPARGLTPLEETLARETMDAYERGLRSLTEAQRAALKLRIEEGYSYSGIAQVLGSSSPDAARMLVSRALEQMARSVPR